MNENEYSDFGIFSSVVKAKDKYLIQSKPKLYKTKFLAQKALDDLINKGWKKSDWKIMPYVMACRNILPKKFRPVKGIKPMFNLKKQKVSFVNKSRFQVFIKQLGHLSSKYGIAVRSVGGVYFFDGPIRIRYSDDHTSGNLDPLWFGE